MHYRAGVRPLAVDFAMDEPFEVNCTAADIKRIPVEVEFHDVGGGDQRRSDAAGEQEAVAGGRMADTDMPKSVNYALIEQDMIR